MPGHEVRRPIGSRTQIGLLLGKRTVNGRYHLSLRRTETDPAVLIARWIGDERVLV
jgi:hypothetical protein